MTATHVACSALWRGECKQALVLAVNQLILPEITESFYSLGVLSKTGRCHCFSDKADGYVRSEGCGGIILKRLSDAEKDGDKIYSVILGSSIGDTGFTGRWSGISTPTVESQVNLIHTTYSRYNVSLDEVDAIEAHGTGTPVGDPIEAEGLGSAFARKSSNPLRIGSAKSNFGHLECASGIVGIIKTVLMLYYRSFVPSIHFVVPNEAIDLEKWQLTIQTNVEKFREKLYTVGVNSFGYGGALAHIIMKEPRQEEKKCSERRDCRWRFGGPKEEIGDYILVPFSSHSIGGLLATIDSWLQFPFNHQQPANETVSWLGLRREHYSLRETIIARSYPELQEKLKELKKNLKEVIVSHTLTEATKTGKKKICFVFPGQGQQHESLGKSLFSSWKVFRETITLCVVRYKELTGIDLFETGFFYMEGKEMEEKRKDLLKDCRYVQPVIVFFQIGLYEIWKSLGIVPDLIVAHSLGEIAGAYACGGLTLEQTVQITAGRAKAQQKLDGRGKMMVATISPEEGMRYCQDYDLEIAAINEPSSITFAGKSESINKVETLLKGKKLKQVQILDINSAYHTKLMEDCKEDLRESLRNISNEELKSPTIPYYSPSQDKSSFIFTGVFDYDFWWNNIRNTVKYSDTIGEIIQSDSPDLWIEISSRNILMGSTTKCYPFNKAPKDATLLSCKRDMDENLSILETISKLYISGHNINWTAFGVPRHSPLPPYGWDHTHSYWTESLNAKHRRIGDITFGSLNGLVNLIHFPYLKDHVIRENEKSSIILPGAVYVEMMLEKQYATPPLVVEDIEFISPIRFDDKIGSVQLVTNCLSKLPSFEVMQVIEHGKAPILKMKGRFGKYDEFHFPSNEELVGVKEIDTKTCYKKMREMGLEYGPEFQMITSLKLTQHGAMGTIREPCDNLQLLHVTVLDACFQIAILGLPSNTSLYLPSHVDRIILLSRSPCEPTQAHAKIISFDSTTFCANITLLDIKCKPIAYIQGFRGKTISTTKAKPLEDLNKYMYRLLWQPQVNSMEYDISKELSNIFRNERIDFEEIRSIQNIREKIVHICRSYMENALNQVPKEKRLEKVVKEDRAIYMRFIERLEFLVKEKNKFLTLDECMKEINDMKAKFPYFGCELGIISKLGPILPNILVDPKAGIEILFSMDSLGPFFLDSLSTRYYYKAGATAIQRTIRTILKNREGPVRVMEIGCRMGGLTKHVLEGLDDLFNNKLLHYVCTDLDENFFPHTKKTLSKYPNVLYQKYDINTCALPQGFTAGSYDIVIVLDTLHSAPRLVPALLDIRELLAVGGWMFLYESTNSNVIAELMFGSLRLCWAFDDNRGTTCWQTCEQWCELVRENGFDSVKSETSVDEFFHSVIVGKKSDRILPQSSSIPFYFLKMKCQSNIKHPFLEKLERHSTGNQKDSWVVCQTSEEIDFHNELVLIVQHCIKESIKLLLITIGANGSSVYGNVYHSLASIGLLQSVLAENKQLPLFSLDLDPNDNHPEITVENWINGKYGKDHEVSIRMDKPFFPRIIPYSIPLTLDLTTKDWVLEPDLDDSGSVVPNTTKLSSIEIPKECLQEDEVILKVQAVSINYKDVMIMDGKLPTSLGVTLGLECAGIVYQVGSGVKDLKPGDNVIALSSKCFRSFIRVPQNFVVKRPHQLTVEVSAGIGIVFLTSYYALVKKALIQKGDWVLIHSGLGGVGQAAIIIALQMGAKVIATAGSIDRQEQLRKKFSLPYVTDSHDPDIFCKDILQWTGNKGVDIVLNSLSGEHQVRSIKLLAPGGRFCEIGKKDILEGGYLPLSPFLENCSFISVQMDLLMKQNPSLIKSLLIELMKHFEDGTFKPVETHIYSLQNFSTAFDLMRNSKHTGKLVISIQEPSPSVKIYPPKLLFRSNATYVVTGAYGGLGIHLISWLIKKGAKRIIAIGRNPENEEFYKFRRNLPVDITLLPKTCDVTKKDELEKILKEVNHPPICGIFHLAAVIENSEIINMKKEDFDKIYLPKTLGALHLHNLSQELKLNLDHFVLFSSVISLVGNVGQSHYGAANAFLDGLAILRFQNKLPALSVQMGAVSDAGVLKRDQKVVPVLAQRGFLTLSYQEMFSFLGVIIYNRQFTDVYPVVCIANQNWEQLSKYTISSKFDHLIVPNLSKSTPSDGQIPDVNRNKILLKLSELTGSSLDYLKNNMNEKITLDSQSSQHYKDWLTAELEQEGNILDLMSGITVKQFLEGKVVL